MMAAALSRWLDRVWYHDAFISTWLMPLALVYEDIARLRRWSYRAGLLASHRLPVPVVVVGNLTVGGTGKTPLVIWLVERLAAAGHKPGVVSRGHLGKAATWPQPVTAGSDPALVGDEAVLIARRTGCPLAVAPDRVAAARWLLAHNDCDLIIADDGLQHYRLRRDVEIVVVDGRRRFGNGLCLPAGPLREPVGRLRQADFVVVNGGAADGDELAMALAGDVAVNLATGERKPLAGFAGQPCHAVAGIGHPQRFFDHLAAHGVDCTGHPFPDHHRFSARDLELGGPAPLLMTEKDAVKCAALAGPRHWYVPVAATLTADLIAQLTPRLKEKP